MLAIYMVEYIPMPSRKAKLSPGDVAALAKGVRGERRDSACYITEARTMASVYEDGWLEYKVQDRISRKKTVKSKIIQGFINMLIPNVFYTSKAF